MTGGQFVIQLVMRLPSVKKDVETKMAVARSGIQAQLIPSGPNVTRHLAIPPTGHDLAWIEAEMDAMDSEAVSKTDWKQGKVSGAVYHGGEDLEVGGPPLTACTQRLKRMVQKIIFASLKRYVVSNQLHPDVFPGAAPIGARGC